ncbi:hypothetical protein R69749_00727 [Paraburkholderia domus]|jgi:hypothetical protein|uniref:Ankyrin repeat domain-containing protein n=1 Tax=Paraburkholderia domus TaxID=2793075 RepID=A0A9N8MYN4_9BURK|nr:hypothetical protein R70006_02112 [Paraburkholderia domus]CAE6759697.1 hypothetical protein R69749_00727 [Paraburkholderia domus]CAE6817988.1 hypothetical protein R75483_06112 [Paraburkholderia domus]CAE6894300.1 hypothetical protein R70211_02908 [Paraburkholderia domus]CAE6947046.1 hypothetical protein R75471_05694 [Paraburkholderia domus]
MRRYAWGTLLNLGAHGESLIFDAARLKRFAALRLLIDAGADPSIPDILDRDRDRDGVAIELSPRRAAGTYLQRDVQYRTVFPAQSIHIRSTPHLP